MGKYVFLEKGPLMEKYQQPGHIFWTSVKGTLVHLYILLQVSSTNEEVMLTMSKVPYMI